MSKHRITLKEVKDVLDQDRSISNVMNLKKYIAMFLDQKAVGSKMVQDTVNKLKKLSQGGTRITENVVSQAFKCELDKLLKDTKFWKSMDFVHQLMMTREILSMSVVNRLLQATLTGQIDIEKYVNLAAFEELTEQKELTPGQKWNMKMQEAKRQKKLEREREAQKQQRAQEKAAKQEQIKTQKEEMVKKASEQFGAAWGELAQHMTAEEIAELQEYRNINFGDD